jgi:hypothetical protein
MTTHSTFLDADANGDMTLWLAVEDKSRPLALVRQREVHPIVWAMIVKEATND